MVGARSGRISRSGTGVRIPAVFRSYQDDLSGYLFVADAIHPVVRLSSYLGMLLQADALRIFE
ncbi:hypothetical protein GCM10022223_13410 [Kineosporia mesophila]|uniref:Uncharacterized protein n=1 Tax=Kineosporia mesophila TaxID=566012 RepID=A0ABP6Z7U7_9ACTN